MAGRYVLTPARRAALKRAQAKSAAKRKGRGRRVARRVAIAGATASVSAGAIYVGAKSYESSLNRKNSRLKSDNFRLRGEVAKAKNKRRATNFRAAGLDKNGNLAGNRTGKRGRRTTTVKSTRAPQLALTGAPVRRTAKKGPRKGGRR